MLRAVRTTAQKTLSAVYVPARGMTLYYNPPPHVPHSSETIAKYKASKHLDQIPLQPYKSSMEWIQEVPVIEVDGNVAICDGDDAPGLGHPREFIQLNKSRTGEPETCKYCGLRYAQKKHHH